MRARSRRTTPTWLWVLLVVVVLGGGVAVIAASGGSSSSGASRSPGPLLAPIDTAATGQTVDGIRCDNGEQLAYHVHAHLAVFVNGRPRGIPAGIGITPRQKCLYWLHSHTDDGVIHIESPTQQIYTLGDYFDIWHQPLSATQVGPAHGPVTAYVNGTRFSGDPRTIRLGPHVKIQLDVGKDVPPRSYTFDPGF